MWFFPLGAAVVSGVFAVAVGLQWARRRRPNLLAWAIALAMFALASFAPAVGMLEGWTPAWFRIYYLFGAIVNVPVLGLGTIYLLGSRRIGHVCAALVTVASVVAAVIVWQAHLEAQLLDTGGIPKGSEVMSEGVRLLARIYSFAGFFVVLGGALWSAYRLTRQKRAELRPLAVANGLIAAGTFVVALGSGFAFYGRGLPFAVGLFGGVCLMFWGFLKTRAQPSLPAG
ncbi:MAG: hypothetical protein ABR529_03575 [Actinomycetota bacterium]